MRSISFVRALALCAAALAVVVTSTSWLPARPSMGGRGGGGGMSRGGGGMSRPAGGMSRPSMPGGGMSRPSMPSAARPSLGGAGSRPPAMPNVSRPAGPSYSRPSLGGVGGGDFARPGGGARPQFPSASDRPTARPPGALAPTRPAPGGFERPDFGGGRPSIGGIGGGERPSLGNVTRPGAGGGIERPGINPPGGIRPGGGGSGVERPIAGGGTRPGGGGSGVQRPIIGGGNRPGGDNNFVIGGGNTIIGGSNINNKIAAGNWNRPGWGMNTRPGSDWWSQNHDWHDHWHDHCIDHHHDWYHGCWNNHWGNYWYAPLAWGAVGWGLGAWYGGGSSYSEPYYNPYYAQPAAAAVAPYDYAQPVVVNNYAGPDDGGAAAAAQPPQNQQALSQFDQGLADFKSGSYRQALNRFDAALAQLPKDPVVHEVRALALFALGEYQPAAAALNSLLATAPGMDWTTMSGLYGNPADYTQQLRKLETWCKGNPRDASAYFVLAYHYLVTGHKDEAVQALQQVVREQPKDATAKRMLDSLAPPESAAASTTAQAAPAPAASADAPQTDLVGSWQAQAGDSTISLTIGDDSQFTWKAVQKGQPPVELKGNLVATNDLVVLESQDQGSMAGSVKSGGPDKWKFALAGAPPGDPGLNFERLKN